jgi:oxygen-independent coproporphyrinogen-3 oxidase
MTTTHYPSLFPTPDRIGAGALVEGGTLKLPRQTSVGNYFISNYPPFSCWKEENIPAVLGALTKENPPGPLGLYVHIPFCRQRCHYCYFRVYPRRSEEEVDRYVGSVLRELSLYLPWPAFQGRAFSSVYFGGGSPSYLSADQIARLLGGLQELKSWRAVEECTFECEPGTVTPEKLRALQAFGVTRLSLGFQSLNDAVLRRSGRDLGVGDCLAAYRLAREAGFKEINLDLLAGLPGETANTWRRTIDQVLQLEPDCVTIYQMELTYNSGIYGSMQAGRELRLPSWPSKRRWVGEAFEAFERAGYVIGSGYMAIRDPSRWRFVYTVEHLWHGEDLLALGETSFGHVQGVHYQNADTFDRYTGLVAEGKLPLRRALALRPEEKLRREVILLLKTGALDAAYFRKKFGVELVKHFAREFGELRDNGLLEIEGDCLRLTRKGLLEVDWLLPRFYLPEHMGVRYT